MPRVTRGGNTFQISVEINDEERELEITYEGYYDPGKTYGPPEDCYPPEGEITIKSVTFASGQPFEPTPKQEEALLDLCWEDFHECANAGSDDPRENGWVDDHGRP